MTRASSPERRGEAGFTLIEILVGLAITLAVALATLAAIHSFSSALSGTYASLDGVSAVDQRIADMRGESSTALSVFVPTSDVEGRPNAALGAVGHEVDFYSKNGTSTPIYWAYRYDATTMTLRRYDYDEAHHVGVRNATTGIVDPNASYPAIDGITSFTAQGLMATQLARSANPYAGAISPAAGARITDLPVSLNNDAVDRPDNFAGNTVVQLHITTKSADRYVHLAAGAFPSGFTYTGGPAYHVVLWRTDDTVKRLFGTRSYAFIWADVDVTYDDWKHYQIWCHQIPIYGEPDGLRPGDPREDYGASDPAESAHHILDLCVNGTGTAPGSNGYFAAQPQPPTPDPYASAYPTAAPGSY